jgi:predicted phage tail protein
VFSLNASLNSEIKTARASELILTNNVAQLNLDLLAEVKRAGDEEKKISSSLSSEVADRKTAVSAEQKRAEDEEKKINLSILDVKNNLNNEITDRQNAVAGVQAQINAIMQGSSENLNSFIEIISHFNSGGDSNYLARLAFLEGVVSELVNKSN